MVVKGHGNVLCRSNSDGPVKSPRESVWTEDEGATATYSTEKLTMILLVIWSCSWFYFSFYTDPGSHLALFMILFQLLLVLKWNYHQAASSELHVMWWRERGCRRTLSYTEPSVTDECSVRDLQWVVDTLHKKFIICFFLLFFFNKHPVCLVSV